MNTVLVIDDCKLDLDTIALILEDAGFQVVCCRDSQRAVDLCREVHFDAVLCDVYMNSPTAQQQGMAGIETMWSLAEEFPALPLIAMSGAITPDKLERLNLNSVRQVLSKPFGANELVDGIQSVLPEKVTSAA